MSLNRAFESFSRHSRRSRCACAGAFAKCGSFLFAFYGLLAGDTALFLLLFPGIGRAPEVLVVYALFSFVGWAIIGLPVALGVPPRYLCRLSGPARLLIGAALGPIALLAIFLTLAEISGGLKTFRLANTGIFFSMSIASWLTRMEELRSNLRPRLDPT